jgi:hypothetical protein
LGYDREADVDRVLREIHEQQEQSVDDAVVTGEALPGAKGAPTSFS